MYAYSRAGLFQSGENQNLSCFFFSPVKTKISLASFLMRETSSRDDPRRGKIMRDHKKCMIKMNDHRAIITVIIAYITL